MPTNADSAVPLATAAPDRRALVAFLLLLSGCSGLVYEVAWARELVLHVGNASAAHSTVIATFMAGLGIGYAVLGRWVSARNVGMRDYARLELLIGLVGVGAGWSLPRWAPWVMGVVPSAQGGLQWGAIVATLPIMPACLLMGATIPAAVIALGEKRAETSLATVYAANSAGAVVGALLTGYWLLPAVGIDGAWALAALGNLLAGAMALGLARPASTSGPAMPRPRTTPAKTPEIRPSRGIAAAPELVAALLAGCGALVLQAAALRFVGLVLGSSTHSFAAVVAAYIAAIAVGSEWARRRLMGGPVGPNVTIAATASLLSLIAIAQLAETTPWALAHFKAALPRDTTGWRLFEGGKLAMVFGALGLPVAANAAILPLLAGQLVERGASAAWASAVTLAFNTAGAAVGVLVGAQLVIASWGVDGALLGVVVLQAGVATLAASRLPARRRWLTLALAAATIGVLALPSWDVRLLSAGAFRHRGMTVESWNRWRQRLQSERIVQESWGADATAVVLEHDGGRTLKVNGKPDASTFGDMITQVSSAHVPLLLARRRQKVLIIGLGSGVTAASALLHGSDVTVVELSAAVIQAAAAFEAANLGALKNPRLQLHRADARAWLQQHQGTFDVIISEPSNPWIAGNAALFSQQFFELARRRLAAGGVLAQWFHAYENNDELLRAVLGTLRTRLDHAQLWNLHPGDVLVVAKKGREPLPVESLKARFLGPIAADLKRVRVHGLPDLLAMQLLPETDFAQRFAPSLQPLDDRRPLLEHLAPRALFVGGRATLPEAVDTRSWPPDPRFLLGALHALQPLTTADKQALYVTCTRLKIAPAMRAGLLQELLTSAAPPFLVDVLFTLVLQRAIDTGKAVADALQRRAPDDPRAHFAIALLHEAANDPAKSVAHLKRCQLLGDTNGRCARRLARR